MSYRRRASNVPPYHRILDSKIWMESIQTASRIWDDNLLWDDSENWID